MSEIAELTTRPEPVDITSEQWRSYSYDGGRVVTIASPAKLYVLASGSHRVVDSDGVTHRPTPGWLLISWKPRDGEPEFVA